MNRRLTDDQGNHGGSIAAGGFKTLYQLLNLPYLNVLLGFVGLRRAHLGRGDADTTTGGLAAERRL